MRSIRFLAGVLLIGTAVAAEQSRSTAEELVAEISGLLARGVSDKKVARRIEEVRLSDCLTERLTVDLLKKYRVGPYTMFALDMQMQESLFLLPSRDMGPSDPNPDPDEMSALAGHLQEYVDGSLSSWKKFVAKTTRTRLSNHKIGSSSAPERIWYPAKRYPFRIPELPESVNTPIGHLRFLQNGSFRWHHWDYCRDRKAAVFEFVEGVDSPSQKAARLRGSQQDPRHGLVSFFPEDGIVCRLVVSGGYNDSHPQGHTLTVISTTITTFGPQEIDHHTYWFPTQFVIMTGSDQSPLWLRNVAIATEYHKLDAQSTVTYAPPAVP